MNLIGRDVLGALCLKIFELLREIIRNFHNKLNAKILFLRTGIIETVINHFKHHYHIWHTRHRSVINAITHLMAGIASYVIDPLKISAIKLLSANNYLTETPN